MKKAIILCLLLSLGGCGAVEPTPIPTPTVTPIPTPYITPVPTPEVTRHPDYEKHYISRESIEGYKKMSESQIQKLLDMYDMGYTDREEDFESGDIEYDNAFDNGYEQGHDEGYDEGYDDGYCEGYEDGYEEDRYEGDY